MLVNRKGLRVSSELIYKLDTLNIDYNNRKCRFSKIRNDGKIIVSFLDSESKICVEPSSLKYLCSQCHGENPRFRCNGCKYRDYCSRECQRINWGVKMHTTKICQEIKHSNSTKEWVCILQLFYAIKSNDFIVVRRFIQFEYIRKNMNKIFSNIILEDFLNRVYPESFQNIADGSEYTFLIIAVYFKNLDIIQELLDNGACPNISVIDGDNPLITAILNTSSDQNSYISLQIIEKLVLAGANVNYQFNNSGKTLLHVAAHKGNKEICKILLENGANLDCRDFNGKTPLDFAIEAKQFDIVIELNEYSKIFRENEAMQKEDLNQTYI